MALMKWYAHKNGTPLLEEWFPMAGDAYFKAADVETWLEQAARDYQRIGHYERSAAIFALIDTLRYKT